MRGYREDQRHTAARHRPRPAYAPVPARREALWTSVRAGLGATAVAPVLGTLVAVAVARFRFFGRDAPSLVIVPPVALPGIVTGIALNSASSRALGRSGRVSGCSRWPSDTPRSASASSSTTSSRGCARTSGSHEEAATDLGTHTFRAFVDVTFPPVCSALVVGAPLAFAPSFGGTVVTTFTAGPGCRRCPRGSSPA